MELSCRREQDFHAKNLNILQKRTCFRDVDFWRMPQLKWRFLRKSLSNKCIFQAPKGRSKWAQNRLIFWVIFQARFCWRPFWPGAQFSRDVLCETTIFETSFSKNSLKKDVQNGAKIDIKMTTKIDEILTAFWSCLGGPPELRAHGQKGLQKNEPEKSLKK